MRTAPLQWTRSEVYERRLEVGEEREWALERNALSDSGSKIARLVWLLRHWRERAKEHAAVSEQGVGPESTTAVQGR